MAKKPASPKATTKAVKGMLNKIGRPDAPVTIGKASKKGRS